MRTECATESKLFHVNEDLRFSREGAGASASASSEARSGVAAAISQFQVLSVPSLLPPKCRLCKLQGRSPRITTSSFTSHLGPTHPEEAIKMLEVALRKNTVNYSIVPLYIPLCYKIIKQTYLTPIAPLS